MREVGILESPAILMPVYEFVTNKIDSDSKSKKSIYIMEKNLNIGLEGSNFDTQYYLQRYK